MSDTIDLLDSIGKDASLRHASAADLAVLLNQTGASEVLKAAVAAGNSSLLTTELGYRLNQAPQVFNAPAHEEEEEPEEEEKLPAREAPPAKTAQH